MYPQICIKFRLTSAASLALCSLLFVATTSQLVRCKSLEAQPQQQHEASSNANSWVPLKNFKPVHRRSLPDSMKSSESRQTIQQEQQQQRPNNPLLSAVVESKSLNKSPQQQQQQPSSQLQTSSAVPTQLEASASVMSETRAPNNQYLLSESRRRQSRLTNGNSESFDANNVLDSDDSNGYHENRPTTRSDGYESRPSRSDSYESGESRQDAYDSRQARLADRQDRLDNSGTTAAAALRRRYQSESAARDRESLEGGESSEAVDEADAPNQESNEDQEPPARSNGRRSNSNSDQQEQDDSQAEQSAQEAAEASEAEAADRAALDEQQQTQREIIRAQAESEAKAIKEQQEALMRQQRLHQQIVMRRAYDLNKNSSEQRERNSIVDDGVDSAQQDDQQLSPARNNNNNNHRRHNKKRHNNDHRAQAKSLRWSQSQPDIQFSDQLENGQAQDSQSAAAAQQQDEQADYSMRRPQVESLVPGETLTPEQLLQVQLEQDKHQSAPTETELQRAAASGQQHSYGAHYGTLHGHQSHYYQFAESHKKGQFDSGYKRGGKKFQISGHSSQKKHHAEGHVKWQGKKGKGSHYWSLKHAGKKHGHGHGYGHGHGHGH